jgi:alpha-beta hydrolase superfamily lysophospholipase
MSCHGGFNLDEATRRSWYTPEEVLSDLKEGMTFVDVGCGDGFFSILASKKVGPNGRVYAVDIDAQRVGLLMHIKNPRTKFDWVSRDNDNIDRYIEDPLCGFPLTAKAYLDIFENHKELCSAEWAKSVPDVPILMFSGSEDPVGNYGKGVKEVFDGLKAAGKDVKMKLYQGSGHEVMNEKNRQEAYMDILEFLNSVIAKRGVTE